MGIPLCARCNKMDYAGEVTVGNKRYSLCGYCLPIINAKIEGIIEGFLQDIEDPGPQPGHHNVFENSPGG